MGGTRGFNELLQSCFGLCDLITVLGWLPFLATTHNPHPPSTLSIKKQAGRNSMSPVRQYRWCPNICGRYPCEGPSQYQCVGPNSPFARVSGCLSARTGPKLVPGYQKKGGQRRHETTTNGAELHGRASSPSQARFLKQVACRYIIWDLAHMYCSHWRVIAVPA